MTVSSTTSRWEYTGDGSTTDFPYTNKVFEDSDLEVYVGGSLQALSTDYTVTGAGTAGGGDVKFVSAPANAAEIVIIRNVPNKQETDYVENDDFPADAHENALDRRTIIDQQQEEVLVRTPVYPKTEQNTPDMTLPVAKAGRAIKWNANADGFSETDNDPDEVVSNAETFKNQAETAANNAATSESNAATSASNAQAHLDDFKGRYYGSLASDPSTDPNGDPIDTGDIYWNSSAKELRVFDGAAWTIAGQATIKRYVFTATAGQTSFSGADDNGLTLDYDVDLVEVYLNGVRLVNGADYTASDGTSIVLSTGAASGDKLSAVVIQGFSVADVVPASGGTFTGGVTFDGGATFPAAAGVTAFDAGVTLGGGSDKLNQYEEGLWTPVLVGTSTAGTNSYQTQAGSYTRVGRLVHITCEMRLDGSAGALDSTGNLEIDGLPFDMGGTNHGIPVAFYDGTSLDPGEAVFASIAASNSRIRLHRNGSAQMGNLTDAFAGDSLRIILSGTYRV